MSHVSSACLTHLLDHLNINTIESLREVTKLRVVGFVGSPNCGKSRMAHSLVGSRTWGGGGLGSSRGGTTTFPSSSSPSSTSTLPKTLSPSEALDCSPLVPLSTVAAINGVSMNNSAAALLAAAVPLDKLGTENEGYGEEQEEDEFEVQMRLLGPQGGGASHAALSSSSLLESQLLVVDCGIPWGCDGLERSVASFLPVFVTPASVVVWYSKSTSSSLEDTVMGLYSCCSVARQLCASRGSGTPSIYERPPSLVLVIREFQFQPPRNQHQEDSPVCGEEEGKSISTTLNGGAEPTTHSKRSSSSKVAATPSLSDSLAAFFCTTQHRDPQRTILLQRKYPNLAPLAAVVRDFFKDNITMSTLPENSNSSSADHGGVAPPSLLTSGPLPSVKGHHGGRGAAAGAVALQKDEREALVQLITTVAATAYTAPSVDDIRRQFSVLRAPPPHNGYGTSSSLGGRQETDCHWSWLSVLESVYLHSSSGSTTKGIAMPPPSVGGSPSSALQRRDEELSLKKDAFLVEEALDALVQLLHAQHGGTGIQSIAEGSSIAQRVSAAYQLSSSGQQPSSNSQHRRAKNGDDDGDNLGQQFLHLAGNVIRDQAESATQRRQQMARRRIEADMAAVVTRCHLEVNRLSQMVAITSRVESEVMLWEEPSLPMS